MPGSASVRIHALNIRMLDGYPSNDGVAKIVSVGPASEAGVLLLLRSLVGHTDVHRLVMSLPVLITQVDLDGRSGISTTTTAITSLHR